MPIYEYHCENCNNTFERIRSVQYSDVPSPCPFCQNQEAHKMPTSASFKIKGFRASNGYGGKFIDTPGTISHTDDSTGQSFHSNKGGSHDKNKSDYDLAHKNLAEVKC